MEALGNFLYATGNFSKFHHIYSGTSRTPAGCRTSEGAGYADAESVPTANPLSAPSYPYLPKTL